MVENRPMFNYLIKWENKYEADKTWAACRTYFIDAAEEIELEVTSESHGFYANFAKEFQAALLRLYLSELSLAILAICYLLLVRTFLTSKSAA